ncbi:MAG: hypothetical protein OHK0013_42080 [Sandaracinaceae bacterium]
MVLAREPAAPHGGARAFPHGGGDGLRVVKATGIRDARGPYDAARTTRGNRGHMQNGGALGWVLRVGGFVLFLVVANAISYFMNCGIIFY